ncbi:MAG: 16S rRNA methyltransferase, partial [Sulfolobaceae archaeon]|nr:16S rRNA methyltransferase [Sulfolobales archaeon]
MFNIILLESSISLLPKRFWNWPEARAYHRRFGVPPERQILDISFHYDVVRTLKNPKLGRPDIVHLTLLSVFAIPPEELGEIYVHTVEGTVYEVSKEVRLPKNYFRFLGLMSQLLSYGRVPPTGKALLKRIDDRGLKELAEG